MRKSNFRSNLSKCLIFLLILCNIFVVNPITAHAECLDIDIGERFTIEDGGYNIRQFPYLSAWDDDVFVSFVEHEDSLDFEDPIDGMRISRNDGATWPTYVQNENFWATCKIKLSNGDILAISYQADYIDARHTLHHYWKSTDDGANWTHYTTTITYPQDQHNIMGGGERGGFQFHRGIIQLADGSLLATIYGNYDTDVQIGKLRVLMVKSTDNGANWSIISEIFDANAPGEGFVEPVIAKCADNSILCVMRTFVNTPMYQCRSTDNGYTWSTPEPVPGLSIMEQNGIDPDLTLMSNGTLVLSYGNHDYGNHIYLAFSLDGRGENWSNLTWADCEGASGYSGVREVSENKLLLVGDIGASYWSGQPREYLIWGKYIDVVRTTSESDDTFKNDTVGNRPTGYSVVGTDALVSDTIAYHGTKSLRITDTSASHQTMALKTDNASTAKECEFFIYPVTTSYGFNFGLFSGGYDNANAVFHLGISPGDNGRINWYDGSKHLLTDGPAVTFNKWNSIRIVAYNTTNANVYVNGEYAGTAGKWHTFSTIDSLRFSSGSVGGTGDEFYVDNIAFTDIDTFEGDTTGQVPSGYTQVGANGTVSTTYSHNGTKSLRIYDNSASVLTNVVRESTPSASKTFSFYYYPVDFASGGGHTFSISNGGNTHNYAAFHFKIMSDGKVYWYDGNTDTKLSDTVSAKTNSWNKIVINAKNTNCADVYINDVFAGTIGKWHSNLTMDRIRFMSTGTVETGDNFYIDNLSIIDTTEDTFETDTVDQVPVNYTQVGASGLVSDSRGYIGGKSLRVYDNTSSLTNIVRQSTPSASKTFSFDYYPVDFASGYGNTFSINSGGNGHDNSVFHLKVMSDGKIYWYDGSSDTKLSDSVVVKANSWNGIVINVRNTACADIYVNNEYAGTAGKWHTFSTVDRIRFMSSGTALTGDDYYIDNVSFYDYYTAKDTFEGDTTGQVPSGYTQVGASGTVSTTYSHMGGKSLRIYDNSASVLTNVVRESTSSSSKTFDFYYYPVAFASGYGNTFSINSGGNGHDNCVYHFKVMSDGKIYWYDGSSDTKLSDSVVVQTNEWNRIVIFAGNTTNAAVYVNNVYAGSIGKWHTFSTIDRIRFMSSGSALTGDDFYIDNVIIN